MLSTLTVELETVGLKNGPPKVISLVKSKVSLAGVEKSLLEGVTLSRAMFLAINAPPTAKVLVQLALI